MAGVKLEWLLFGLLAALCGVIVIVLVTDEGGAGHGVQHAQFRTMDQGGSGLARHGRLLVLGGLFGTLQILLFVACLALGARQRERLGRMKWPLLVGGVAFMGVYAALVFTYRQFIDGHTTAFLGPFPTPTALMLFGLWPLPVYFMIIYAIWFDRWLFTAEDQQKLDEIVAGARQRREAAD